MSMTDDAKALDADLSYVWDINAIIAEQCFKNCKKYDGIYSPIFNDASTNTKWMLSWYPYGDDNNVSDNDSRIYLELIYKSGDIKQIEIKNKTIHCKQINQQFVWQHTEIYDKYTGYNWGLSKDDTYKVNELKEAKELTFEIKFNISNIIQTNDTFSIHGNILTLFCVFILCLCNNIFAN